MVQFANMTKVINVTTHLMIPPQQAAVTDIYREIFSRAIVISHLDNCSALHASLPAGVVKPLEMIQNAAACLVFNHFKKVHVTLLLTEL